LDNLLKKIAIGTVQFGLDYGISNLKGRTDESEVNSILNIASDNGIELLDTAQAYGESEAVLGRCHKNRFEIITKLNPVKLGSLSLNDLVIESMNRLCVKSLYGVLFHNAQSALENTDAVKNLLHLKETGILKKVGYSVYKPEELCQLIQKYGKPDLVQIPFSHLDRRFESIVNEIHSTGVEIHARSIFLQGLFFIKSTDLPPFFNPIKNYLSKIQKTYYNSSLLASFLLNYVISQPFIDKVVIGINNSQQLLENMSGLAVKLPKFEFEVSGLPDELLIPYLWPKK